MVIARKPRANSVDDFISQAGAIPEIESPSSLFSEDEIKGLKMRIPSELLKKVDEAVASRRPTPSRHQWILEAIYEKLDKANT